ncbi:hypothetical protein T265_05185 [Opisthorchis viverrini]|uniref:Uncharacterized protein n=1 Tax=Opisthorchis viverrini TaxID=6198 RepID=A0A074ZPT3_OPIVI|nr:hypothetical protein T265_05185 [Opisthorchis viverrini]KER27822.1 hypothetical protein T265_05185 [Opisthorchis viverrini]
MFTCEEAWTLQVRKLDSQRNILPAEMFRGFCDSDVTNILPTKGYKASASVISAGTNFGNTVFTRSRRKSRRKIRLEELPSSTFR